MQGRIKIKKRKGKAPETRIQGRGQTLGPVLSSSSTIHNRCVYGAGAGAGAIIDVAKKTDPNVRWLSVASCIGFRSLYPFQSELLFPSILLLSIILEIPLSFVLASFCFPLFISSLILSQCEKGATVRFINFSYIYFIIYFLFVRVQLLRFEVSGGSSLLFFFFSFCLASWRLFFLFSLHGTRMFVQIEPCVPFFVQIQLPY